MTTNNQNLHSQKKLKNDEFYTQLPVIENEMNHYVKHFKNKTVLCNCDDPRVSNFTKYFLLNFERLKLKKLMCTCYKSKKIDSFSKYDSDKAVYLEYNGYKKGKKVPDLKDIEIVNLESDGDFRSKECIKILKQADIVCTNPPFSLFREYVSQIIEHKKKFVIIGNQNALTYKEVFKLIKNNEMWLGVSIHSGDREFGISDDYTPTSPSLRIDGNGKKFVKVVGVRWFTNLDYEERYKDLILYERYTKKKYPKYVNYDAIDVGKTKEIPVNYKGKMGVPITFMDKYNPDQFEVIGLGISSSGKEIGVKPYTKEHRKYRKEVQKRGVVDGDLYMITDGKVNVPYARIVIKHKGD